MKVETPEVLGHFVVFEGKVNHFYLDTKGIVTIGIGCALTLNDALDLSLLNKESLIEATRDEIKKDFTNTQLNSKGRVAEYYGRGLVTYLPEFIIDQLFYKKLHDFEARLSSVFSNYLNFSDNVQFALLDMAFNLGVSGILNEFPDFTESVRDQNWLGAARECVRLDVSLSRNDWTQRMLLSASKL